MTDPALTSVLNLTRQALSGAPTPPPLPVPPLTDLTRLLRHHRLVPWLARRGALPPSLRTIIRHRDPAPAALQRIATLLQFSALFEAQGIPWLTLKGPVLAQQLWGDPTARHVGDIDLVVPPAHFTAAARLVEAAGYIRIRPWFALTARQEQAYRQDYYEYEYRPHDRPGPRVELKWRLESVDVSAAASWSHLDQVHLGGRALPTLAPVDNFRYLCHHGSHHAWYRLHWLVDVAALLQKNEIPWSRVLPSGREHPSYRPVALGCLLAERVLGVHLPADLLPPGSAADPVIQRLLVQAESALQTAGAPLSRLRDWTSLIRFRLALAPTWSERWHVLRPHIFSSRNWWTLPLPDRLFWLYPWLSPFLWLWRKWRPRAEEPC